MEYRARTYHKSGLTGIWLNSYIWQVSLVYGYFPEPLWNFSCVAETGLGLSACTYIVVAMFKVGYWYRRASCMWIKLMRWKIVVGCAILEVALSPGHSQFFVVSVCNIEKLGVAWGRGYSEVILCRILPDCKGKDRAVSPTPHESCFYQPLSQPESADWTLTLSLHLLCETLHVLLVLPAHPCLLVAENWVRWCILECTSDVFMLVSVSFLVMSISPLSLPLSILPPSFSLLLWWLLFLSIP